MTKMRSIWALVLFAITLATFPGCGDKATPNAGNEASANAELKPTEPAKTTATVRFQVQEKGDELEFFVDDQPYEPAELSKPMDFSFSEHQVTVKRDGEILFEVPFDAVASEDLLVVKIISPMRTAAMAIIEAGGSVKSEHSSSFGAASDMPAAYFEFDEVSFYGKQFDDTALKALKDMSLRRLDASYSNISDDGLRLIGDLSQLKELGLNRTNVTANGLSLVATAGPPLTRVLVDGLELPDEFLEHLQKCKLDLITASDTNFSDRHMAALTGKVFWWCHFDGTNITDEGLKALSGTKIRRELRLSNTQISDEGLKHLLELGELGKITLKNTRVTEAGCEILRERFPEIEISL